MFIARSWSAIALVTTAIGYVDAGVAPLHTAVGMKQIAVCGVPSAVSAVQPSTSGVERFVETVHAASVRSPDSANAASCCSHWTCGGSLNFSLSMLREHDA